MAKHFFFLCIICVLSSFFSLQAQHKYFTRNGHISFFSKTPVENITADNKQVASILDATSGELVFSVLMKSFQFPKALMQEHFNESYIESDKYPKSTFKGKIQNIQAIDFTKEGVYAVDVTGDLTIHGVTKPVKAGGTLEVKDNNLYAKSLFTVAVADYNIQIPKIVQDNIAKNIDIQVDLVYEPMKQ